jgi:hypothetical protein
MLLAKHAVKLLSYKYSLIPTSKCKFKLNFSYIISLITLLSRTVFINYTLFKHFSHQLCLKFVQKDRL